MIGTRTDPAVVKIIYQYFDHNYYDMIFITRLYFLNIYYYISNVLNRMFWDVWSETHHVVLDWYCSRSNLFIEGKREPCRFRAKEILAMIEAEAKLVPRGDTTFDNVSHDISNAVVLALLASSFSHFVTCLRSLLNPIFKEFKLVR